MWTTISAPLTVSRQNAWLVLKIFTMVPAAGATTILSVGFTATPSPTALLAKASSGTCSSATTSPVIGETKVSTVTAFATACGLATGAAAAGALSPDAAATGPRATTFFISSPIDSAFAPTMTWIVCLFSLTTPDAPKRLHIASFTRPESATVRRRRVIQASIAFRLSVPPTAAM